MKNAKSVLNISAFYNGFPGIHHASLRHGTICVYYIPLTVLRGSIIIAAKKMGLGVRRRKTKSERIY